MTNTSVVLGEFERAGLHLAPTELGKKILSFHVKGDATSVFVTSIRGIAIRPGGVLEIFLAQTFYLNGFGSVAALKYQPQIGWMIARALPLLARHQPVPVEFTLH